MTPSTLTADEVRRRLRDFAAMYRDHPLYVALRATSTHARLVGGSVRDVLLGRPLHDHDVTVPSGALALARRVADVCGGSFVPLKAERGMARVVLNGEAVDISDAQGGSLDADLRVRDLTINAMAIDLVSMISDSPVLIDLCGGLDDLCAGLLRCPSVDVLDDDPLRLMRVVRFACTLGFGIEAQTRAALPLRAPRLNEVAAERVRDELFQILGSARAFDGVACMQACDMLCVVLPELAPLRGLTQGGFHHLDVFEHTLAVLRAVDGTALPTAIAMLDDPAPLRSHLAARLVDGRSAHALLNLAALLHDVGKPASRRVKEDGGVSYAGHAQVGAEMIAPFCARMRLSTVERVRLTAMVARHLEPLEMPALEALHPHDIRRYFERARPAGVDTLVLALADSEASRGPKNTLEARAGLHARVRRMLGWHFSDAPARCTPLLDGTTIGALVGEPPGPAIRAWLEALADAQADGEVATREEAVVWTQAVAQSKRQDPS